MNRFKTINKTFCNNLPFCNKVVIITFQLHETNKTVNAWKYEMGYYIYYDKIRSPIY
jgi:hypothetical protein